MRDKENLINKPMKDDILFKSILDLVTVVNSINFIP